jgi:hypothetical protein
MRRQALALTAALLLLAACGSSKKNSSAATTTTAPAETTTTAGPPDTNQTTPNQTPDGFVAIPYTQGGDPSLFGQNVSAGSTKDNRPIVVFSNHDANGDDSTIVSATFNATTGEFDAPVTIAKAKLNDDAHSVSLASNLTTGTLVVVWDDGNAKILGAQSTDEGKSWTPFDVATGDSVYDPSVAITNGSGVAVAFVGGPGNTSIATGDLASATFTVAALPAGADGAEIRNLPPSAAAGADGTLGIVYEASPPSGGASILYLAVGQSAPVTVVDSKGIQNDDPLAALSFAGSNPIVAATLCQTENQQDTCNLSIASSDGGATFGDAVAVAADSGTGPPLNLAGAADDHGNVAVAYNPNSGNGSAKCGTPDLALSTDEGQTWTICGPASPDPDGSLEFSGGRPSLWVTPEGDLVLAFQNTSDAGGAPLGVLVRLYPPPSGAAAG